MNTNNKNFYRKGKLIFIPFIVAIIFGLSAVVMLLWNNLLPYLFKLPEISLWQSMGLILLTRILFGGFHFRKPHYRNQPFMDKAFKEKFMTMSDDERQEFKEQWKQRCGRK